MLLDDELYTLYFVLVDDSSCVSEAFLYVNLVSCVELFDNPFTDILGSRIEVENLVEVGMIHLAVYDFLDVSEVFHHTILVEFVPADEENFYLPVVSMHAAALAFVAELKRVGSGYF